MTTKIRQSDQEENKALARKFVEEVFVKGNMSSLEELVAPDFTHHNWPFVSPGKEGLKQLIGMIQSALTDIRIPVEDSIPEGDKVVIRMKAHGRHSGEFMGIPPTNKEFVIDEIHIFRITGGKFVEHWREADTMGMMQQLGVMASQ